MPCGSSWPCCWSEVYQGIKDHINLDLVKCVLMAGPGFVKERRLCKLVVPCQRPLTCEGVQCVHMWSARSSKFVGPFGRTTFWRGCCKKQPRQGDALRIDLKLMFGIRIMESDELRKGWDRLSCHVLTAAFVLSQRLPRDTPLLQKKSSFVCVHASCVLPGRSFCCCGLRLATGGAEISWDSFRKEESTE